MTWQQESQNLYSAHFTDQWSWEKIAPYQEALNAALKKYAKRFPDDVCLQKKSMQVLVGA
ncbi:hypothetical protein [Bartonella machadoae]|uniref:hypothetical protein n=1 Tax=Bartonella machadoae TaxID=2893471 RepID=UPI001F4CD415|nr:hypothetical protein [Bartonella machadoae]UNE55648.1 hypothetical protein LNM86_09515 [Bartonella machadoae]